MLAKPISQLNPHALCGSVLCPPKEFVDDVKKLISELANEGAVAKLLQGTADDDRSFRKKIKADLANGSFDAKLVFSQFESIDEKERTEDSVPLSGGIDQSWARPLSEEEIQRSATVIITLQTFHPKHSTAKPSIRMSVADEDNVHFETRPVKGPWKTEKVAAPCTELKGLMQRVFAVDVNRTVFATGCDKLNPLFTSIPKWRPEQHVVVDKDTGWSLMPHYISKPLVSIVSTYVRPQVVGIAAMGGVDAHPPKDLVANRVTFRTQDTTQPQRAVLALEVHQCSGVCWCGVHPRCCSKDDLAKGPMETKVKIEILCCGRKVIPDGTKFVCWLHNATTRVYDPPGDECAVCMEDLSIVVKCTHSEQLSNDELATGCLPNSWVTTKFAIQVNAIETILLGHVLCAAARTHDMLQLAVRALNAGKEKDNVVASLRWHMGRAGRDLLSKLGVTQETGSAFGDASKKELDEIEELTDDSLYNHDREVVELLRSGNVWLQLKPGQVYKSAGIRKTTQKTPLKLEQLGRVPDLMARVAVSGQIKKYKASANGAPGSENVKNLPSLYRRLVPLKIC